MMSRLIAVLCLLLAIGANAATPFTSSAPLMAEGMALMQPAESGATATAGAMASGRRSLSAAATTATKPTKPTMCLFSEADEVATSSCAPNPDYLAALATTKLAKSASPIAQSYILGAAGRAACTKHNVTTAKGMDECAADTKNGCYLWANTATKQMSCFTRAGTFLGGCKGTLFQEIIECAYKTRTECASASASACEWQPLVRFITPKAQAAAEQLWANLTGGKHQMEMGGCYSKQQVAPGMKGFNTTGAFNFNAMSTWKQSTVEATDPATFTKYRGGCDYAKKALARIQYSTTCDTFNILDLSDTMPYGTIAIRDDKLPNTTNIMACLNAKCRLIQQEQPEYTKADLNITYGFVECHYAADLFAGMQLNAATDGAVYTAYTKCNSQDAGVDKAMCLGFK